VSAEAPGVRYVALGDSYTIGTSVGQEQRWPNQLVRRLAPSAAGSPALELVANLAVNGHMSRDVIDRQLPPLANLALGFVSLLVGVNDVIQGVAVDTYHQRVDRILGSCVTAVGSRRVLAVTTPDYTVTPAGADYGDPEVISARIQALNAALTDAARSIGVAIVDIHDISLRAAGDRSLVAGDGLHPSGRQYELWVDQIAPVVHELLAR
jgi:acyl-CoA thioesterase I